MGLTKRQKMQYLGAILRTYEQRFGTPIPSPCQKYLDAIQETSFTWNVEEQPIRSTLIALQQCLQEHKTKNVFEKQEVDILVDEIKQILN